MWKPEEAGSEADRWGEERRSASKAGHSLPEEVAFVGKDVEFKGVITYSGTVRIDGALDGEIHTDGGLLVGPEAKLRAKITAGTVVCHGTITGDIEAKTKIVLCAPAVVDGSLITPMLSMEEGVIFNGTLEMTAQATAEAAYDPDMTVINPVSRLPVQRLAA